MGIVRADALATQTCGHSVMWALPRPRRGGVRGSGHSPQVQEGKGSLQQLHGLNLAVAIAVAFLLPEPQLVAWRARLALVATDVVAAFSFIIFIKEKWLHISWQQLAGAVRVRGAVWYFANNCQQWGSLATIEQKM